MNLAMADAGPRRPTLLDLGTVQPPPAVDRPRGRKITAASIIRRHFIDAETKNPIYTQRWVRDTFPYKIHVSRSRCLWFEKDVIEVIEESERTGVPIKDVKLVHLEATKNG